MPSYPPEYKIQQQFFNEVVENTVRPFSKIFDKEQSIPRDFFFILAEHGFLGASIPKQYGGQGWDDLAIGLLHESVAKELCSLENILTVTGMVCKSLMRFGSDGQRQTWLPEIAAGKTIVAIALTEPNIGSDLANVQTQLSICGDKYSLHGKKKYITLGQIADLFLVLANFQGKLTAILVEKDTLGLSVSPMSNFLGFRSNMLAEVSFEHCLIPETHILGSVGAGLTHVIAAALDVGRYTTAWGCVGLGQACVDAALDYTSKRTQYGQLLNEHQLTQKMMTEMIVEVKAARELCFSAAILKQQGDPDYIVETLVAKYFASKMTAFVSGQALQLFGASGLDENNIVERYYRDAKVMEIIEGTSQMHEILISKMWS